jgi:hypothetical protein
MSKLEISEIKFKASGCEGECPIFEMVIKGNRMASYNAKMYNKLNGYFKTTLDKPSMDSLVLLIEKSEFFTLQNNYTNKWTDHPTYTLTISLKSGQVKTIEDYGPSGPEKLKSVYEQIFSLRESQSWQ